MSAKSFEDIALAAYKRANVSPSAGAVVLSMAQYADWWSRWSKTPNRTPPKRIGIASRENWWKDGEWRKRNANL